MIAISERTQVFAASFEKPVLHLQSVRMILPGEEYEFVGQSAHPPSTPYLPILHASHSPVIVGINPSTHIQSDSDRAPSDEFLLGGQFFHSTALGVLSRTQIWFAKLESQKDSVTESWCRLASA